MPVSRTLALEVSALQRDRTRLEAIEEAKGAAPVRSRVAGRQRVPGRRRVVTAVTLGLATAFSLASASPAEAAGGAAGSRHATAS